VNILIAFHHVTLIDGTGRDPLPDATVAVRDRRIVYAGESRRWLPSLQEDILNIDLSGKHLLPGLIDCHAHLAGTGGPDGRFDGDDGAVALRMLHNARRDLELGITTICDLGGWNGLEFAVRSTVQRDEFCGPRLLLSGRCISASEAGLSRFPGMYLMASGADAVRKAVRGQLRHGADLVSLGVTGSVFVESESPGTTRLQSDEIVAAVQEAAKAGRRVAAHAHGIDGIRRAVLAGVHTIEHGTYLHKGRDVIHEMARRGTCLVPGLKPAADIAGPRKTKIPDWMVAQLTETRESARESLRLAYQAGIPIAAGSEAGTPRNRHGTNALEVHWLQQAGLGPMDALVASTLTAAQALGREDEIGSVEEGKLADLLIMDADPLEELTRLADANEVRAVFVDGRLVARRVTDAYPKTILARDCLTIGQ
jgi:imidazolonepropionase-like amidohydrolase